jgi:hypothetical protein
MQLSFAMLARAADAPKDLAYIHGAGLDSIHFEAFPGFTTFAVVVGALFSPEEISGDHVLRVDMTDPQGNRQPMHDGMPIVVRSHRFRPQRPVNSYSILAINWMCAAPGEYRFHVVIDDMELTTLSLFVNEQERVLNG